MLTIASVVLKDTTFQIIKVAYFAWLVIHTLMFLALAIARLVTSLLKVV